MHVGHLRSTIIGDTLSNVLEFAGHDVVRLNHVGDWGTQFGMLVEHMRDEYPEALSIGRNNDDEVVDLGDLVVLYKAAKMRFDADEEFRVRARDGVVRLQGGEPGSLAAWEALRDASRAEYRKIYDALGIRGLEERGESFYNPYLADLVSDLETSGLAVESDGAMAVFLGGGGSRTAMARRSPSSLGSRTGGTITRRRTSRRYVTACPAPKTAAPSPPPSASAPIAFCT